MHRLLRTYHLPSRLMSPTATTGAQLGPSTISPQSILRLSTGHGWPFSRARRRRTRIRFTSAITIFPPVRSTSQLRTNGGQTFGPSVDVLAQNGMAQAQSFCNTIPSGIELDPETGEVYVQWITADPVANTTQGCNISQIQSFHQVWVAHAMPAVGANLATVTTFWDAH